MHEDVVCSQPIGAAATTWMSRYHGQLYLFCSLACRERFELEPEDYLVTEERRLTLAGAMLRLVS